MKLKEIEVEVVGVVTLGLVNNDIEGPSGTEIVVIPPPEMELESWLTVSNPFPQFWKTIIIVAKSTIAEKNLYRCIA